MDLTDRQLLNIIQSGFPLVGGPYCEFGNQLELTEAGIIGRT